MHHSDSAGRGEALFLAQLPVIERVIDRVCTRNRVGADDADDFGSLVKLKCIEDNYAILTKFEGRSSFQTYLTIVIQRLFLDYRTSAWGKWRPSAEAKRLGPLAVQLEQLLARDGYSFEEACEVLKTNHRVSEPRSDLEYLAERLPARARRRLESEDALVEVASPQCPADAVLAERELVATAQRASSVLQAAMAALDSRDRLILALRFQDGRTVSDVASVLRVDPKGLYRRLERLLKDLRRALEAQKVDSQLIPEILETQAVSFEWSRAVPESTASVRLKGKESRNGVNGPPS